VTAVAAAAGRKRWIITVRVQYSLARMQKRLFRGPAVRARDIIGAGRVYTGVRIPAEYAYSTVHTRTHRRTSARARARRRRR